MLVEGFSSRFIQTELVFATSSLLLCPRVKHTSPLPAWLFAQKKTLRCSLLLFCCHLSFTEAELMKRSDLSASS